MIGALRHRITIQSRTDTDDLQGGKTTTWSTFATVWARVRAVSGKERFFAGKTEHNLTHRIKMRYRDDITSAMRVSWDSRVFQIHGVRPLDDRERFLELDCVEGVAS